MVVSLRMPLCPMDYLEICVFLNIFSNILETLDFLLIFLLLLIFSGLFFIVREFTLYIVLF